MAVNGNDSWEDGPEYSFTAGWSGQASRVGVITSRVDGLHEVSQVDVTVSLCVGITNTLDALHSKLDFRKCKNIELRNS